MSIWQKLIGLCTTGLLLALLVTGIGQAEARTVHTHKATMNWSRNIHTGHVVQSTGVYTPGGIITCHKPCGHVSQSRGQAHLHLVAGSKFSSGTRTYIYNSSRKHVSLKWYGSTLNVHTKVNGKTAMLYKLRVNDTVPDSAW